MKINHLKIIPLIAWWLLIAKFLTIPSANDCELCVVQYLDKIIHFILFFVLAWLLADLFYREFKTSRNRIIFFTFSFGLISAYFFEYFQQFIPGRISDVVDLLAGAVGIIASLAVHQIIFPEKLKLLLHICCAGCGAYVSQKLLTNFKVTLLFYNPNLFPEEEYQKRLKEAQAISRQFSLKIIEGSYNHEKWLKQVRGLENCPEKGDRCRICYQDRLEETAKMAVDKKFDYFTSTLTVSPHKNAKLILELGNELAEKCGVKFWSEDFKQQGGYQKSVVLSKELNLYRQNYCGCEFSFAALQQKKKIVK